MRILDKNGLNAKENQKMKVIDTLMVAVKKDEIIIGHLPQKIFQACKITFTILTLCSGLASLG